MLTELFGPDPLSSKQKRRVEEGKFNVMQADLLELDPSNPSLGEGSALCKRNRERNEPICVVCLARKIALSSNQLINQSLFQAIHGDTILSILIFNNI